MPVFCRSTEVPSLQMPVRFCRACLLAHVSYPPPSSRLPLWQPLPSLVAVRAARSSCQLLAAVRGLVTAHQTLTQSAAMRNVQAQLLGPCSVLRQTLQPTLVGKLVKMSARFSEKKEKGVDLGRSFLPWLELPSAAQVEAFCHACMNMALADVCHSPSGRSLRFVVLVGAHTLLWVQNCVNDTGHVRE